MLVLKRKVDERIVIGDEIEIVVVAVEGESVRLGIKAPKGVSIYRAEIYEEIKRENLKAAGAKGLDKLVEAAKGLKK